MNHPETWYELGDLLVIAALSATLAYLAGRAHAERAAERARNRRRAHRHQQTPQNPNQRKESNQ